MATKTTQPDPKTRTGATGTVRLHRILQAPPERVYKAFIDPGAMVKWIPPRGFTAKIESMDARVGGSYRMSFTNFGTGRSSSFGGEYLELTPSTRLRYTDAFDDPNLRGEIVTTVEMKAVPAGTELEVVQEGLPAQIPVELATLGWQESLDQLKDLVEPNIPDVP